MISAMSAYIPTRGPRICARVNALAYAVGRDVVFGADRYAPATSEGRKLIAHELIHVAQQLNNAIQPGRLSIGPAGDAYETEADSLASQAVKDGSAKYGNQCLVLRVCTVRVALLRSAARQVVLGAEVTLPTSE